MSTRINFHTTAPIKDGQVEVGGESEAINPDATLVSRHVALQQNTAFDAGVATGVTEWAAKLSAEGFDAKQPALAIATETHVMGGKNNPGPSPAFITVTWSQIINLEKT
jgi:hypothetical protein